MNREQHWDERFDLLDDFSMGYETSVVPMFSDNYLQEFYDFYRVRNRQPKLIPSEEDFWETLKEVSGDDCWKLIAEKTELLFGGPARVTVFDDDTELREEMGGRRGFAPFFFVNLSPIILGKHYNGDLSWRRRNNKFSKIVYFVAFVSH